MIVARQDPDAALLKFEEGRLSTNGSEASANDRARNSLFPRPGLSESMDSPRAMALARRFPDFGLALKSLAAFWILYMSLITIRAVVLQYPDFWPMLGRRSVVTLVGVLLTLLVYFALRPFASASLNKKAVIAGLLCLPASVNFAAFNYYIFYVYSPLESVLKEPSAMEGMDPIEMALRSIIEQSLSWYFLFAAWAALYVAMSYAAQLRASDNRAAAFAREAQEAQLRALRYQINPHFLFNTLNSLSSLILTQRTDVAERMIMNLANFFRTTLSADPTADIPLAEEIKLQQLYLDIEKVRFPERLKVEIQVPEELSTARVPVLILQPIVENAIKYGVARSKRPVTLRILAYEEAAKLHLKVKDDGDSAPPLNCDMESTGVGLNNVCDRLVARYGLQAGCFHGTDPQGGYTVHVVMPVNRDG